MQDYNTIIGAIQMRLNKCPTRSVMDRFRIGSSTLNLIMSRYKALELTINQLEAMSPKEVENLFYPQKNLQRKEGPLPDFQYYYDRIHAPNSRINISFCWLDYKEKNPNGYEKSQFYEYYQRFVQENYGGTKISMAVNRKPSEKMYIEWVGDHPGLLTDVTTGEIMKVHIFATTLGVSSIIYAEAFPNEKLPCFIEGCVHAVSFYGAVAKHFVPDKPCMNAFKEFIHMDMSPDKGIHLHIQCRFYIGVLTVRKRADKEVYRNYFAGGSIYITHGWT